MNDEQHRIAMDKARAIADAFNLHFDAYAKKAFVIAANGDPKLEMSPDSAWQRDPYNAYERAVAHTQSDPDFVAAIEEYKPNGLDAA